MRLEQLQVSWKTLHYKMVLRKEQLVSFNLKQGPATHLQQHAYEYRRKFDAELAAIRRLKELQVRGVAFVGTVLLSALVGAANFASRIIYDGVYAS